MRWLALAAFTDAALFFARFQCIRAYDKTDHKNDDENENEMAMAKTRYGNAYATPLGMRSAKSPMNSEYAKSSYFSSGSATIRERAAVVTG